MPRSRIPDYLPALLVLGLAVTWMTSARQARATQTQEAAQAEADTVTPPQPETTIAIPDIARRAEEALGRLREIAADSTPLERVVEIEESLPALVESLERLRGDTDDVELSRLSQRRLEAIDQEWARHQRQLDEWQAELESRSRNLEARLDTLGAIRDLWRRTREAAAADVPEAVVAQIDVVLSRVEQVEGGIRERLSGVLTLQNQVADRGITVAGTLAQVEAARQRARRLLLAPDSPPLWEALFAPRAEFRLTDRLREALRDNTAALTAFFTTYERRVLVHVILFALLLALILNLRRRAGQPSEGDASLEAAVRLLDRPLSAAALIALLLTRRVYPEAPPVVVDVATVAMLIPVLRLLPAVAYANVRGPLYGVASLVVVERLVSLGLEGSVLGRLILLGVAIAGLIGLAWFLRPGGAIAGIAESRWGKAAVLLARIGFLTFGISILANVLGIVSLAELLSWATLTSAYLAILLLAVVLVVDAVVLVLLRTGLAQSSNAIRTRGELVYDRLSMIVGLAAVVLWLIVTLSLFGVFEPLRAAVAGVLGERFAIGEVDISLGDVLAFILALWAAVLLSRIIRFFLEEDVMPRIDFPRGVPGTLSMLVHYMVLAFGFLVAIAMAGIDLNRFAIVAGALGVGIGFGLQNVVNNFVSGLILIFERPIHIGDTIQIESLIGVVQRIGIRASIVRTLDGAEVIVPNGNLIAGQVVNWTLSDRQRRIEIPIGVAYGTDPRKVLEVLLQVARDHKEVLKRPEPVALFRAHGDSSLDFVLRFWTGDFDHWYRVASELTVAVNETLKREGIEIPFPQRDLHLRSVSPSVKEVMREEGPRG